MLLSKSVKLIKIITSKFFSILSIFFKSVYFFIIDTFELFLFFFVIFCCFFVIYHSLQKACLNFGKIFDHLNYDTSTTIEILSHLFNKKDNFLHLVIFSTFLVSLNLTICNCIKKSNNYFCTSNNFFKSFS